MDDFYPPFRQFLSEDGRTISVGDCALFKPPQDSPPFIGIIRKLTVDKEGNNLKLGVNWLYRPSEVKLRKGILLEAAPNEVFYSFHQDEIPAASLLHPCKVAFLRKGVELPSGISAFVCRRVYDIENKCLWWLTDKDYINERQEEINNLLEKSRLDMHVVVPSGGRSPKTLNGPASTTQSKPSSESIQNSTSFSSQGKGKKRERVDPGCDPSKRERLSKPEDGESGQSRAEQMLKSEISKITVKGGLLDFEGVEKLVQLMQSDGVDKKMNLASRIMLVDVIAVTDRFDCLGGFLELRGLPILDEWLQDVRKGKIGDGGSPRDGDKSVEDFLLAVLCALDKLPVNLQALQTCNVGKSVNHLRTHKNSEIQKKARNLVDTWKRRVEAEMKIDDTKCELNHGASWSTKPAPSEVSHVGNRKSGPSAEDGVKSSTAQSSASKGFHTKGGVGDNMPKSSPSPGSTKSVIMSPAGNLKDPNLGMLVAAGSSDPPLTPIKEERSSSSSHSQNNSRSCSSDHAKAAASSCREDTKSSTTGSVTVSKSSSGSRQRKSVNGAHRSTLSGGRKDTGLGKSSPMSKNTTSDKTSPTVVQHDKLPEVPVVEHGNNQRLIVRLPNTGRSSSRAAETGRIEESEVLRHKASPPDESHDNLDRRVKMKIENPQSNDMSSTTSDIYPGKDGFGGPDKPIMLTACGEKRNPDEGGEKIMELAKATQSILGPMPRLGKPYEGSLSSMDALVESCVKFSEARGSPSPEDDVGMNLLASVATGEITKSGSVSPSAPSERLTGEETFQVQCQPDDRAEAGAVAEQGDSADQLKGKNELKLTSVLVCTINTGDDKGTSVDNNGQKQESIIALDSSSVQLTSEDTGLKSTSKPDELKADASVPQSTSHVKSEKDMIIEGANHFNGHGKLDTEMGESCDFSDSKLNTKVLTFDDDKKVNHLAGRTCKSSAVVQSKPAAESMKVEKDNEKLCYASLELGDQKQNSISKRVDCDILAGQKASPSTKVCNDLLRNKSESINPLTATGNRLYVETKGEAFDNSKTGVQIDQNAEPMGFGLSVDQNGVNCKDNLKTPEGLTGCHVESQVTHGPENSVCQNSNGPKFIATVESESVELQTSVGHSSVSAAGSGMGIKLDFDLNEGIPSDDGSLGEPIVLSIPGISPSVHLSCPLPNPISSMSGSFSTSITVAAAAKGSFVPPENLLRMTGELGWKGSAATSAFRPAEPKRNLDIHTSVITSDIPSKQCRPPLDFDLNETSVEDVATQGCTQASCSDSTARDCGKGGLDLDLNRIDEVSDGGVFLAFNGSTSENPELPSRLSLPVALSSGLNNTSRGFDLNDGPGADEVGQGTALPGNAVRGNLQFPSPIPAVRMNCQLSWFPAANSYPAITVPSMLSGRGEQYVGAAAGSQRILAPNSSTSFGSEMFRGPVLSSSPALPFSSSGSFQYPGFPFETNFPLAANTFSGASTAYIDSSTGGPLRFANIPPQLVGSNGLISSPFHRPYMMNIQGGTNNVASNNRKGGGQLDLNAGPG